MDEVGPCLPMLSEHRIHDHGSASSVGSVASSTKLAAATGNALSRPSRRDSSSSDIANSLAAAQRDEVLDFSSFNTNTIALLTLKNIVNHTASHNILNFIKKSTYVINCNF